jgi:hypothetical protein
LLVKLKNGHHILRHGIIMDSLEKEILKYEKKGFKVEQKRTLKYGSRTFLVKKGGFLGTDTDVYIYYVDGDVSTDSFREFFKDYAKFYQDHNFDSSDRGLFLCSGNCDEKLFKDLRKAMIRDEDVRNSIKLLGLGETTEKEEVVEETEIEAPRRKVTKERETETQSFRGLLEEIKRFNPHKKPDSERELETMLLSYLTHSHSNIEVQQTYERARIDARIGKIGIEIKYQPNSGELDRLYGQVEKYLRYLDKIIVVIGYEKTRESIQSFQPRIEKRGWLNSKVFVVSLR